MTPTAPFALSRSLILSGLTGLALLFPFLPAQAADGFIRNIRYDAASHHFLIEASGPVKAMVNTLKIAGHKRIIIDVDNAEIAMNLPRNAQLLDNLSRQMPLIRNVTVNQYGGDGHPIVRILMDLQGDPGVIRLIHGQGSQIELELNTETAYQLPGRIAPVAQPERPVRPTPRPAGNYSSLELPPSLSTLKTIPIKPPAPPPPAVSTGNAAPPEMKRTLVEMNRKYDALAEENQALRSRLAQEVNAPRLDDMKRTLVEMNRKYDALAEANRTLQARLATAQSSTGTTSAEADRLKSENRRLQSQIEQLRAAGTKSLPPTGISSAEADRLKSENRRLQSQIEELRTAGKNGPPTAGEADRLKSEIYALQLQLERLRASRNHENAQAAAAIVELDRLKSENRRLQGLVEQVHTARSDNGTVALPGSSIDVTGNPSAVVVQTLRKQVSVAQQSLNDAIRTINEQNKEIAYLRNQVADVKSGLDISAKEQIAQLQSTIAEKDAALQRLGAGKSTSSPTSAATTSSRAETEGLKRQLATLTRQYQADLQTLNRQLQTKNEELAAARNNASAQSAAQNMAQNNAQERDRQLAELRRERDAARQDLAAARQDLAMVRAELDKRANIAVKRGETEKLARDNAELRKALDDLRIAQANTPAPSAENSPAFRQVRDQLAELRLEQSTLNQQLQNARQEQSTLSQQLQNARQELTNYRKSHPDHPQAKPTPIATAKPDAAAQKRLAELERQLTTLKTENQSLRTRNAQAERSLAAASAVTSSVPQPQTPKSAASLDEAAQDYRDGKASLSSGNLTKAIEQLKEAHLLDGDRPQYVIDYSAALAENRQNAEAIEVLRRYVQRHPNERDVYNQLGKVYLLNEQPEAANQAFTRAISTSMLNNYATSLKKLDRMPEAENVFKLALALNPHDSEVLFNLGNLYNAQNKLELARNQYLEAIQIRPDFAEAHYNLGLIFSKLGDNAKAVTHLEKFLQLSPNARNAETIRAYVQKLKA